MDHDTAIDFGLGEAGADDDRAELDVDDAPLVFQEAVGDIRRSTRRGVSTHMRRDGGQCALDSYFLDLEKHRTLSNKKEQWALARRIRAAKAKGRTKEASELETEFLLRQLRIGVFIARRSRRKGVEFEDRIQEGNIGLIKAVRGFDPERRCTFFTYSKRIVIRAIQQADDNTGRTIRLPSHVIESLRRLNEAVRQHERQFGEMPTAEQIAQYMGVSVKKVNGLLRVLSEKALTILDAIEPGESEAIRHKSLSDTAAKTLEELTIERDVAAKLNAAIDCLSEREARVIRLFYGLETGVPLDLKMVASQVGISYSTARSDRDKALEILRDMEEVGDLRDAS